MSRHLDTRVESTLIDSIHAADRIIATPTTNRTKPAKCARSEHKTTRTEPHATKPEGASMDYQMGFTSGPSG